MPSPSYYCLLYTSNLTPGTRPAQIVEIVRAARHNNKANQITGLLAFDGAHFCQYIEGEESAVRGLYTRIVQDSRHQQVKLRYEGTQEGRNRFNHWSMAYGVTKEMDLLLALEKAAASNCIEIFMSLLDKLDVT